MILGAGTCATVVSPLTSKPRAGIADARVIAARMDRWWPSPDASEHPAVPDVSRAPGIPGELRSGLPRPAGSASNRPWPRSLLHEGMSDELLLVGPPA